MYALVGTMLSILIGCAFIASFFGELSFSATALLVSSAVFGGTSIASSWLLGKLYGVSVHLRSAGISALILTLLFTPSLDPMVLMKFGFIAVLAQASKYVLAYKGRHIFNPAAIGALLGGAVLQLQFASWWVGTPILFIPLLITACIVLYATRQLRMGGLFIAISVSLVTISSISRGLPALESLNTAFTSWPILFAAGFMLTEPLTLPPRQWQKLIVASVAAAIIALPFHIGNFYSSPEFALAIGNLVAFALAFRQRRQIKLVFEQKEALTASSYEFTFTTDHPVSFEPGQYIELTLPHKKQDMRGTRRMFSVTSTPNTNEVRLGIKFYEPGSTFKKALLSLKKGNTIQSTGITGDFVLPKDPQQKLLFIAGGIGITPFISHIRSMSEQPRDITLLYFMRSPDEAAFKELLDASGVNVHYFVRENASGDFKEALYMNEAILDKYVADAKSRATYISGPPSMVAATKLVLKGKVKNIHTDYFSGY